MIEKFNTFCLILFIFLASVAAWWQDAFFELEYWPNLLYTVGIWVWIFSLVVWLVSKPIKWFIHYRSIGKTNTESTKDR